MRGYVVNSAAQHAAPAYFFYRTQERGWLERPARTARKPEPSSKQQKAEREQAEQRTEAAGRSG